MNQDFVVPFPRGGVRRIGRRPDDLRTSPNCHVSFYFPARILPRVDCFRVVKSTQRSGSIVSMFASLSLERERGRYTHDNRWFGTTCQRYYAYYYHSMPRLIPTPKKTDAEYPPHEEQGCCKIVCNLSQPIQDVVRNPFPA